MGHVEYIERLIEEMQKEFDENPASDFENADDVTQFRTGVIFGMKYVVQSLKNPIDFKEEE